MLDNTGSSRPQAPGRAGKKEWVGPSNRDGGGGWGGGPKQERQEQGQEKSHQMQTFITVTIPDLSQRGRKGLNHRDCD